MAYLCKFLGIFPKAKDVKFTPETDENHAVFQTKTSLASVRNEDAFGGGWICGYAVYLVSAADFVDACNRKGIAVEDMLTILMQKQWIHEKNYGLFEY